MKRNRCFIHYFLIFLVAAILALATGISSAVSPSRFALKAPIQGEKTGYVFFNITPAVYDESNGDLSDIRIYSAGGKEIPYIIWNSTRKFTSETLSAEVINRTYVPKKSSTFTLDLGGEYFKTNRFRITTTSTDFTRRVTIEGSPDNREFVTIKDNAYIFDFTTEHGASGTEVSYPTTDYRYLRVTIWDDGEDPLEGLGGEISIAEETKGETTTLKSDIKKIEQNREEMTTETVIDLKYKNIPSDTITLKVEAGNFRRDLHILAGNVDDPNNYDEVLDDHIYSINTTMFSRERLTLVYPEVQARYLKVIIENRDDAPLKIKGVEVMGTPKKITLLAEPGVSYFLYLHNRTAGAPYYDIEDTFSYVDTESISQWRLGKIDKNPDYIPTTDDVPFSERHPWILWGAIVLMVVVLGGIIIRMMMTLSREGGGE
ncbi:MAG: DUF3999 family protein [Deltaproteobacteria bacterium]|uniref:DUF3999 family protein n=1 Tax=Candidatus Zymogenus saltonus TaxID=2844893 RepID=A0A9D8K9F2_9DELT|nr:DUF3999 family protein [Candidatus Zymogenus saltonus]